jgi:hypothetical protein
MWQLYQPDAEIGYAPRANATLDYPDETGRTSPIHTDVNGVRVDSTSGDAREDSPAIAVIGDSFVASLHTPDGQTFCNALSAQLGGRRVLNFGVLGYSNFQEMLLARRWAPKYKIDGLVLVICANNDLGDNLTWRDKTKPNDFTLAAPPGRVHMLARKSQLLTFVTRLARNRAPRTAFENRYDWREGLDKELLQYDRDPPAEAKAALNQAADVSVEALADFRELADEMRVPRLAVLVPAKAMVYREILFSTHSQIDPRARSAFETVAQQGRGFDFDRVRETWRDVARRADVPMLDLTDAFRAHHDETLYGQIDRHWTARGQALAAEEVARALREQKQSAAATASGAM